MIGSGPDPDTCIAQGQAVNGLGLKWRLFCFFCTVSNHRFEWELVVEFTRAVSRIGFNNKNRTVLFTYVHLVVHRILNHLQLSNYLLCFQKLATKIEELFNDLHAYINKN